MFEDSEADFSLLGCV